MTIPREQVATAQQAKSDEVSLARGVKADSDRIAETIPAPQYDPLSQNRFKSFHRNLCERFGYVHDEVFWWRDLASLEEHIARMVTPDVDTDALRAELTNTRALADKLQHLLTSKEHECEALRAHACDGGCKPDLDTVALLDLIRHVALFMDSDQSLTIYGDDTASVQAFGKSFVCNYGEVSGVLDASAMLARLEAV